MMSSEYFVYGILLSILLLMIISVGLVIYDGLFKIYRKDEVWRPFQKKEL